ncbi:MAG: hypothetical protein JKP98_21755 [Rhodobacteraceae bacterium]|nr:hypothetical protein [Paracoccaceae bacterium]
MHGEFTAPILPHPHEGRIAQDALAPALGLDAGEIGFGGRCPGLWRKGPAFLYVPVASCAALSRSRPAEPHRSRVMAAAGLWGAYLHVASSPAAWPARP